MTGLGKTAIVVVVIFYMFELVASAEERKMTEHHRIQLSEPVTVTLAPPEVRGWGPYQFPCLIRLPDGRIRLTFHMEADSATAYGLPPGSAVSADEGRTWKMEPRGESSGGTPVSAWLRPLVLPNGDWLFVNQLRSRPVSDFKLPPQPLATFYCYGQPHHYYRVEDLPEDARAGWMLYRRRPGQAAPELEQATVRLPGELRYTTAGVLVFPWVAPYMVVAPDGAVWAVTYGRRFADGRVQDKWTVSILRSTDNAHSFDLWSEIPYRPNREADSKADVREGFTEPFVNFMPDGSALCLLRTTDGNGVGPLYWARSTDNGRTWTEPAVFDDLGVWPQMLTLENGVTIAAYGRPGLYLRTTADRAGLRWGEPVTLVEPGQLHMDTCSYSSLLPLGENRLLVAYSNFNLKNAEGKPCKGIQVRLIDILLDDGHK